MLRLLLSIIAALPLSAAIFVADLSHPALGSPEATLRGYISTGENNAMFVGEWTIPDVGWILIEGEDPDDIIYIFGAPSGYLLPIPSSFWLSGSLQDRSVALFDYDMNPVALGWFHEVPETEGVTLIAGMCLCAFAVWRRLCLPN